MAKQITIPKEKAIELYTALGYQTAKSWNKARLERKIKSLPEVYDGTELDDRMQVRLDRILAMLKKGGSVKVNAEEEQAEEKLEPEPNIEKVRKHKQKKAKEKEEKEAVKMAKKAKKTKKATKKTTKKKATVKKPATKKETGKDKFGSRLDSDCAKINAVLSKKAKSTKQIMSEAKLTASFYWHLNKLVKKNLIEKTEEKLYKLI